MPYLEVSSVASTLTTLSLTSSGYIQFNGSTTSSSLGYLRFPNTSTMLTFRDQADSLNISGLSSDSTNSLYVGGTSGGGTRPQSVIIDPTTSLICRLAGNNYLAITTTNALFSTSTVRFAETINTPVFGQAGRTTDAVTYACVLRAGDAYASAVTNINGGVLRLQGGAAKTDGSSGLRGGVRLELSSAGVVMAEVAEVAVGQRVVALAKTSAVTSTDIPTNAGDGVVFIGNAATEPTANPANGGVLYASAGIVFARQASSVQQCVTNLRIAASMSDADYTCTLSNYRATIMEFTGTLTGAKNVIVPTVSGYQWTVFNNTTGGFAITIKTSAGTGVAIAAGKRAIVYGDGTNIVRVTPDT